MSFGVFFVNMNAEVSLFVDDDLLREVIGLKGNASASAVEEDGQADLIRAALVENFVHRGADRSPGFDDIIDEKDMASLNVHGNIRRMSHDGDGAAADVVPVERGLYDTVRQGEAGLPFEQSAEQVAERHAAIGDPEDYGVAVNFSGVHDLVGQR